MTLPNLCLYVSCAIPEEDARSFPTHFTAFDSLPTESSSSAEKVLRNSVLSLLVLGGPRSSILFDSLSREGEEEISVLEESNFNSRFRNLINYLQLFELRNEVLRNHHDFF